MGGAADPLDKISDTLRDIDEGWAGSAPARFPSSLMHGRFSGAAKTGSLPKISSQ